MKNIATLALSVSALLMGSAHAENAPASAASKAWAATASQPGSKLPRADVSFLKDAAQAGHAEVEGSKLALKKSSNDKVKAFAQQMVDDHTKVGDELTALAKSKGLDVPTEPSLTQKAKLKILSARDGSGFDKHYADAIGVDAHQDTIKLFQKASKEVSDPEVKAFITKTLPGLEHHLQMAIDLKAVTTAHDKK